MYRTAYGRYTFCGLRVVPLVMVALGSVAYSFLSAHGIHPREPCARRLYCVAPWPLPFFTKMCCRRLLVKKRGTVETDDGYSYLDSSIVSAL